MKWLKEKKGGGGGNQGLISTDFSLLLRGICCLIIVIHHYAKLFNDLYGIDNIILKVLAYFGGYVGVGVFFFLSGYGIPISASNKTLSFTQILRKRYWKLIWPIMIINSVYLIVRYFLGINNYNGAYDLVVSFFNIKEIDRALWFIEILFYCYALFYIYAYLARMSNRRINKYFNTPIIKLLILTFLFTILTLTVKHIYVERFWYHINIPMFWLGVVYSENYKYISKWMTPIVTSFLFIIISGLTLYFTMFSYIALANVGFSLAAVIIIIGIARKYYIVTAYNSFIGIISLEVYITHYKLLDIVSKDRTELVMSFWLYLVISLFIGLVSYIRLKRELPTIKKCS